MISSKGAAFISALALFAVTNSAHAEKPKTFSPGTRVNFVACPVIRNTFIPAWLSYYDNELFYLGPQGDLTTDINPPQLGHQALIEGVVSDEERISGGIVLSQVKVSVLPELDGSCNTILPAAGHTDPPHQRTPGPRNAGLHQLNPPKPLPTDFKKKQSFEVPFSFDISDHFLARHSYLVHRATTYILDAKPSRIEIIGYRGGSLLSNGELFMERPQMATERMEIVSRMLVSAGIPDNIIKKIAKDAIRDVDGVDDYKTRIVKINVIP